MDNKTLAKHLTRKIFECGDDRHVKTRRIQFRGMRAGDEIGLGGFCESALADFIHGILDKVSDTEQFTNDDD